MPKLIKLVNDFSGLSPTLKWDILEAVGVLAGGIAHDFNNLLTAIIGHGEIMLLDLPEGDPLSQRVRDILEAAFQGNYLTKQLLAFSRRQVIQLQVVNLNDVVSEMENMISPLYSVRHEGGRCQWRKIPSR